MGAPACLATRRWPGGALASGQGEPADPTQSAALEPGAGYPGAGDGAALAAMASEVSAGTGAKAGVSAGTSINLSLLGPDTGGQSGAGSDDTGSGGAERGPIGIYVPGTDGDDVIIGTEFDDHLSGGPGNDTIHGLGGDDLLDGGAGNDRLFGGAGNDKLLGGSGNDLLDGGSGDDWLDGGTGNDRLLGGSGSDRLDGGAGNDLLDGGLGDDRMSGGTGNDRMVVDHLHDLALENWRGPDGGGIDLLQIEQGFADSLPAGVGAVTFVFSNQLGAPLPSGAEAYRQQVGPEIEHVVLNGTADHDVLGDERNNQITGNEGDNTLQGGAGNDVLRGNGGDDRLLGGQGDDVLYGGAGDDLLLGGEGDDILHGGAGDDVLKGGHGADLLYGGAGNDAYQIGLSDSAVDTIFDHEGSNLIALEGVDGELIQTALVGQDLHVLAAHNTVAVFKDYLGHEGTLAGIDTGRGVFSVDDLMAPGAGRGQATGSASLGSAPVAAAGADLLAGYLGEVSLAGSSGADHLIGTSGPDWLSGLGGDDHLQGGAGNDLLEGGPGNNLLEGGSGDDRYLFKAGEAGFSTIRDVEGSNFAELQGFTGASLKGVVVGADLVVVASHAPVFKVESFVSNEKAFAGVQLDDTFIPTEDLLA